MMEAEPTPGIIELLIMLFLGLMGFVMYFGISTTEVQSSSSSSP